MKKYTFDKIIFKILNNYIDILNNYIIYSEFCKIFKILWKEM